MQCLIDLLFLLCVAALLEDLDDDELVAPRETEVRVFADEFIVFVLGYDLPCVILVWI